jgi:glycine/D-amino acid oxidase-like deaminating enzyme
VLLELAAPQTRLHSGGPWWLIRDGLDDPVPRTPSDSDVVIVGAGITGALVADALAAAGLAVVLIDRRLPGTGSTAVSTALLQYELDTEVDQLIEMVGEADAIAAYRRSAQAIGDLAALVATLPDGCGFARRTSLYLASAARHTDRLKHEADTRQHAGLDVEFCSQADVAAAYGLPSYGALRTSCAAVVDPLRLTRALLARAQRHGAVVLPWTTAQVAECGAGAEPVVVVTDRGRVRCRRVILACGYELPPCLQPDVMRLHSTYALITEPTAQRGPLDQCIVWESARPYTYMRGVDHRVIVGGADITHRDAWTRDRHLPERTRRLERELGRLIPGCDAPTSYSWTGTFGETRDGMPLIGPVPGTPNVDFALGYGGNGITFSAVAADILRDNCLGTTNPFARIFRPDR